MAGLPRCFTLGATAEIPFANMVLAGLLLLQTNFLAQAGTRTRTSAGAIPICRKKCRVPYSHTNGISTVQLIAAVIGSSQPPLPSRHGKESQTLRHIEEKTCWIGKCANQWLHSGLSASDQSKNFLVRGGVEVVGLIN